jgi:hypothetical protein
MLDALLSAGCAELITARSRGGALVAAQLDILGSATRHDYYSVSDTDSVKGCGTAVLGVSWSRFVAAKRCIHLTRPSTASHAPPLGPVQPGGFSHQPERAGVPSSGPDIVSGEQRLTGRKRRRRCRPAVHDRGVYGMLRRPASR